MNKKISAFLILFVLLFYPLFSEALQYEYVPPEKASKLVYEFGTGLGGSFGVFGVKASIGGSFWSADLGLGIGPLAEGFVIDVSPGFSVYLKKRYESIRPKLSVFLSSVGYTLNVMEKITGEGTSNVLYQENFSGIAALIGFDWRLGKASKLCLEFGLGYVYPFAGYNEVKRINDEQVEIFELLGYEIEDMLGLDTVSAMDFICISLGINYALGRSLEKKAIK